VNTQNNFINDIANGNLNDYNFDRTIDGSWLSKDIFASGLMGNYLGTIRADGEIKDKDNHILGKLKQLESNSAELYNNLGGLVATFENKGFLGRKSEVKNKEGKLVYQGRRAYLMVEAFLEACLKRKGLENTPRDPLYSE